MTWSNSSWWPSKLTMLCTAGTTMRVTVRWSDGEMESVMGCGRLRPRDLSNDMSQYGP